MATVSGVVPPGAPTGNGAATAAIAAWETQSAVGRALVAVAAGAVVGASAGWLGVASVGVVAVVASSLLVLTVAALVDAVEHRLPNALVAIAAVPVVVMVVWSAATGTDAARGALVGALLCGGPVLVTHLVSPAGLGFGDVKAVTVLGGALGAVTPVVAVAALVASLLIAAATGLVSCRRHIALGPALIGGSVAALIAGRTIGVAPW